MERLFPEECNPKQLSPLTLAFVGDCVFELFVRKGWFVKRIVLSTHCTKIRWLRCVVERRQGQWKN